VFLLLILLIIGFNVDINSQWSLSFTINKLNNYKTQTSMNIGASYRQLQTVNFYHRSENGIVPHAPRKTLDDEMEKKLRIFQNMINESKRSQQQSKILPSHA